MGSIDIICEVNYAINDRKEEGAGDRVRERGEGERLNSSARVANLLRNGEGLSVEFKRCSGRIEHDVFETIGTFDCGRMKVKFAGAFDCSLWYNVR